ncbi:hypothetical protein AB0886_09850 [Streptomyces sp. NPDC024062]|uniref:hypothetical protein n=1 Tax=unclassified Streptomyces TaxID=2593676 RepID=UPI0034498F3D
MSYRTTTYPSVIYAVLILVIGLTILITGVITARVVGPTIIVGTITTLLGTIATAVTGQRAVRFHIRRQIAKNDSEALAREILRHDAQFRTAPTTINGTIVELGARRTPRENAT